MIPRLYDWRYIYLYYKMTINIKFKSKFHKAPPEVEITSEIEITLARCVPGQSFDRGNDKRQISNVIGWLAIGRSIRCRSCQFIRSFENRDNSDGTDTWPRVPIQPFI